MISKERQEELKRIYTDPNYHGVFEVTKEELRYLGAIGKDTAVKLSNELFENRISRVESDVQDLRDEVSELREQLHNG